MVWIVLSALLVGIVIGFLSAKASSRLAKSLSANPSGTATGALQQTIPVTAKERKELNRSKIIHYIQSLYRGLLSKPQEAIIIHSKTTGRRANDEILELAIINLDGDVLFNKRIRPHLQSWKQTDAVNGITPAMVQHCPSWSAVYDEVVSIFKGKDVLAWNLEFELQMLRQTVEKAHRLWEFDIDFENSGCVMTHYGAWVGERYPDTGHYKYFKLEEAACECGAPAAGAANALNACFMAMQVVKKMAA